MWLSDVTVCPGCGAILDESASETWETVNHGHGWGQRAGAVALVVVAFGLWIVGGPGGDDPGDQPGTIPGVNSTLPPDPGPVSSIAVADNGARRGTSREPLIGQPDSSSTTAVVGDGSPLLGRTTGLSVFVGTAVSLRRLDLDTGTVTYYDVPAAPAMVTDDWLVVSRPNGTLRAVPVEDPDSRSRPLPWPGRNGPMMASGPDPDQMWLLDVSSPQPHWTLIDITDGEILGRHQAPESSWASSGGAVDPAVTGSAASGIYVRDGERYLQVSDGQLLAISDPYVLVRACDRRFSCNLSWRDRPGFRPVDRPLPDEAVTGPVEGAWLTPDGRMLSYTTPSRTELFDVERGEVVMAVDEPHEVVASSDARYVAALARDRLHLYDTETGVDHLIDVALPFGARILFVDNS